MENKSTEELRKNRRWEHWEIIALYLVFYDVLVINASYFLGLLLRFDLRFSAIPGEYLRAFLKFAPAYTIFTIIVFWMLHLYKSLWRFASFSELNRILAASGITTLFHTVGITVFVCRMPVSYYVIGAIAQFCMVTAVRFAYRFITLERARRAKEEKAVHKAIVIGAGAAGQVIVKELKNSLESTAKPVCVIDDNSNKWGRLLDGIPIIGGRDCIMEAVKKYHADQIMFAIPTASAADRRDILNICKETGCELQSLPGVFQLVNGEVSMSRMKPVAVEDLLGREQIGRAHV